MVKVRFHKYCGLAGDSHALCVGRSEEGNKESVLFNRAWFFSEWSYSLAKKKVLKQLTHQTGRIHFEGK